MSPIGLHKQSERPTTKALRTRKRFSRQEEPEKLFSPVPVW